VHSINKVTLITMKKNIYRISIMCLLSVLIIRCDKNDHMFVGSDTLVTITRDFSSFDRIIANDDLEVNVIQGNTQLVEIKVNENLQDQLITRVNNNTLDISLESGSYQNEKFEVNIEVPNLVRLQLNDNTKARVNYSTNELELDVNDSSALNLRGTCNILNIDNNDDGAVSGFAFTTEILNTTSDDASEIQIVCNGELNGNVSDAASVRYRGMPTINAKTSDAGQIIDAN